MSNMLFVKNIQRIPSGRCLLHLRGSPSVVYAVGVAVAVNVSEVVVLVMLGVANIIIQNDCDEYPVRQSRPIFIVW